MPVKKITTNLMTTHMAETVRFYTDLLGFEVGMSVPEEAPYNWVQLNSGNSELMFQTQESMAAENQEFEKMTIGASMGLYFEIDGLTEIHKELRKLNVMVSEIEEKFYGMNECHLKDPNGYYITLAERAK